MALDPAAWHRFELTLADVRPSGQPFIIEVEDEHRPDGRTECVPLSGARSVFYSWCDSAAAAAMSGQVPEIVHAGSRFCQGSGSTCGKTLCPCSSAGDAAPKTRVSRCWPDCYTR